jgi:Mn-dependent DtxR family transcriptional regulator
METKTTRREKVELTASDRLMLLELKRIAEAGSSEDTGVCLNLKRMSKRLGCATRTVSRCWRRLEALGVLELKSRRGNRTHPEYEINVERLKEVSWL